MSQRDSYLIDEEFGYYDSQRDGIVAAEYFTWAKELFAEKNQLQKRIEELERELKILKSTDSDVRLEQIEFKIINILIGGPRSISSLTKLFSQKDKPDVRAITRRLVDEGRLIINRNWEVEFKE